VTALLQGALGSGRALLIGWFLPCLINLLVLGFVAFPRLSGFQALASSGNIDGTRAALFILVGTAVSGVAFAALQTPLYRILEGYLGWPERLYTAGRKSQLSRKHLLSDRLRAAALVQMGAEGTLSEAGVKALREFREHPIMSRYTDSDARKGRVWLNLLAERLARFPASDEQVNATSLGNAIRRLEEYGYDRFLLDSQVLWNELYVAATDVSRKQVDDARMNVDFLVCLLYGHLVVAVAGLIDLCTASPADPWPLVGMIIGLPLLALLWYRIAVVATDDWAGAVRALVNLGRQPLASSLGLELPLTLARERTMWSATVSLVQGQYAPDTTALDEFRATGNAKPPGAPGPGGVPGSTDQAAGDV
jgi:hypothetical protein